MNVENIFQTVGWKTGKHVPVIECPDQVHTHQSVITTLKLTKPGTLLAAAYCNIHCLWGNSRTITVK